MNPLEKLTHIMRVQQNPREFLYDKYFLDIPKPYPLQEEIFTTFYGNPLLKEFIGVGGMGSGKSFLGSLFICMDTFDLLIREDPAKDYNLASHSPIRLLCVAKSDDQANDTIFSEVATKIRNSPFFSSYSPRIKYNHIYFRKHLDVEIFAGGAASAPSLVGRNLKCVVYDELPSYDETKSQRGAWQVYTRIRKSTNRFGFLGHVAAIASPWHVRDIIMTLASQYAQDPHTLVKYFATWDMNPTKALDSPEMQAELSRDPITFWRDYGIQPHSSADALYPDLEVIRINRDRPNVLEPGKLVLADPNRTYILSIDPGTHNCAFGIALLHLEGNKVIADGLWRLTPKPGEKQIDPTDVKKYTINLCKKLPIRFLITDQWSYQEMMWEMQKLGVQIEFKPLRKEEHDAVRNAWFEDTIEICDYPYVITEFAQLLVLDSKRIGLIKGGKIDVVDALTRGFWALRQNIANMVVPTMVEVI